MPTIPAPVAARPNILVLLTDDHGQWAGSAYGNREIHSPGMGWLARTGACLERAFCPLPVCSPARASFWTGQIPSAHGLHDWLQEPNENPVHHGIAGRPNLGNFLRESGYRTGMVGKWHAGDYWRKPDGFDTWFTSALGTNARFGVQRFYEDDRSVEHHGHQEVFVTERAIRFLRESCAGTAPGQPPEHPFFLFVGYTNTHTPHSGEVAPLADHYRSATFADLPDEPYAGEHGHARIAPFDPRDPRRREQLAQYYAAVEAIDQQLVRLIAELENLGQLDSTLIVYTSDHGHLNGHHGLHTKGNATIPNNFLDESILVPALLRWPAAIAPGRRHRFPADHCDLFATLLDAAGAPVEAITARQKSPGRSYLPLLRGEILPWRDFQVCEHGPSRMARTESAKLIRRYPNLSGIDYPDEFYDLASDPRECRNVLADPAHAPTVAALDRLLQEHFSRYEDPAVAGTNLATLLPHNPRDPWRLRPGQFDERQ